MSTFLSGAATACEVDDADIADGELCERLLPRPLTPAQQAQDRSDYLEDVRREES